MKKWSNCRFQMLERASLEETGIMETMHISIWYFPTELYYLLNWDEKKTSLKYFLKPLTIVFTPRYTPCFLQSFRIYWIEKKKPSYQFRYLNKYLTDIEKLPSRPFVGFTNTLISRWKNDQTVGFKCLKELVMKNPE